MKEVPLNGKKGIGKVALVDDEDYESVSNYKWHLAGKPGRPYAQASLGQGKTIRMHLLITGWPRTDHQNHNGLDNRRSNLRPATDTQNSQNRTPRAGISSRFKGVTWNSRRNQWIARIQVNGKRLFLGYFSVEEEAAHAYNEAAKDKFGEFAYPNEIDMTAPRASASGIRRPASGITLDVRRLIRLRHEKSWNREDLARAAGISRSMIGKIENRERHPRADTLAAICAALGCEVRDLLPKVNPKEDDPNGTARQSTVPG